MKLSPALRHLAAAGVIVSALSAGVAHAGTDDSQVPDSSPTTSPQDLLPEAYRHGTLRVTYGDSSPPFYFRDEDGEVVGLVVDVASELQSILGS